MVPAIQFSSARISLKLLGLTRFTARFEYFLQLVLHRVQTKLDQKNYGVFSIRCRFWHRLPHAFVKIDNEILAI